MFWLLVVDSSFLVMSDGIRVTELDGDEDGAVKESESFRDLRELLNAPENGEEFEARGKDESTDRSEESDSRELETRTGGGQEKSFRDQRENLYPPEDKDGDEFDTRTNQDLETRDVDERKVSAIPVRYYGSCRQIKQRNLRAPSREYAIRTIRGRALKVYCEMGLNGGGYTFIRPSDLLRLTSKEVQALFTDRTSFLMRVRKSNSSQPYGVLEQLPQYRNVPLKLGLNENSNYKTPVNVRYIDRVYLYYGFLPISRSRNIKIQGLQVNHATLTYRYCDSNPNSYIALFPNFRERTPTTLQHSIKYPFCDNMFAKLAPNPSTRLMPNEYFMFMETHWGGCGCFTQTDDRLYRLGVLGAAIGFK